MEDELDRLKSELEAYRQRELADLRQQLAEAKQAADHYRAEAQRNADIGRQIASDSQSRIAEMRMKLDSQEQTNARVSRFGS